MTSEKKNYKLIFFAPVEVAQNVAAAMFEAGAGKIGNYDSCCFITEGTGQFRPLRGSEPHIGEHKKLEFVRENKVEMICPQEFLSAAVEAMKEAHPYEEPAYDIFEIVGLES